MERYNYDLIRDRVVKMMPDDRWKSLPFDKDFLKQAICLGTPVNRLVSSAPMLINPPVFSSDWGKEIVAILQERGESDPDRLDQAIILRSYDLIDIDPLSNKPHFEPKNYYVMVVHMRNAKMVTLAGITLIGADRPAQFVAKVEF